MNNEHNQFNPPGTSSPLHAFFIQQGQHINRLYEELRSNTFAFGLKVVFSVILQIACYLLFAFGIYLAIMIPTDLPSLLRMMGEDSHLWDLTVSIPVLTDFLVGIKIILALISLPVLICALLLGRNRRKSMRVRRAFNETELMKKNYDTALQQMKL